MSINGLQNAVKLALYKFIVQVFIYFTVQIYGNPGAQTHIAGFIFHHSHQAATRLISSQPVNTAQLGSKIFVGALVHRLARIADVMFALYVIGGVGYVAVIDVQRLKKLLVGYFLFCRHIFFL